MRRRTTASALLAAALLAGVSAGQPPVPPKDTTDTLIQKALANDPDVQVARAKLALAEAEVAKARQATVGRVVGLRAVIDQQRAEVSVLGEMVNLQSTRRKAGAGSYEELLAAEAKFTSAKAALARSETELRLLTGDGPKFAVGAGGGLRITVPPPGSLPPDQDPEVIQSLVEMMNRGLATKVSGPIPDRIRAALDKKHRYERNLASTSLSTLVGAFRREAGLEFSVRPSNAPELHLPRPPDVELPFGAWFEMFHDDPSNRTGPRVYVRDYGLLIADPSAAPPGAVTITEFWYTRPAAVAKQPEPKQPAEKRTEVPQDKLPAALKAKAGETLLVSFPVKTADVEDAKVGSDTPAVVARVETRNGMLVVAIRSERAGKARVTWDITDATGRRFTERGREVEFE